MRLKRLMFQRSDQLTTAGHDRPEDGEPAAGAIEDASDSEAFTTGPEPSSPDRCPVVAAARSALGAFGVGDSPRRTRIQGDVLQSCTARYSAAMTRLVLLVMAVMVVIIIARTMFGSRR